jgi:hypothetical protein
MAWKVLLAHPAVQALGRAPLLHMARVAARIVVVEREDDRAVVGPLSVRSGEPDHADDANRFAMIIGMYYTSVFRRRPIDRLVCNRSVTKVMEAQPASSAEACFQIAIAARKLRFVSRALLPASSLFGEPSGNGRLRSPP